MREWVVLVLLTLGAGWAQIERPSPIPSRNKRQVVDAPPPQQQPKKKQDAPKSDAPKGNTQRQTEGEAQRPAPPRSTTLATGGETGLACFYNLKPGNESMTKRAAHPSLATGTKVRVTNLGNKKTVVVTVTDHADLGDRIISVSQDAAQELDFLRMGTARVRLEVVKE